MFEELDKFKTVLNSELRDLAERIETLEKENKILKEQIAELIRLQSRLRK